METGQSVGTPRRVSVRRNVVHRWNDVGRVAGLGPYFNTANGTTEQGFPYQDDAGHITVSERRNDEAISANDDVKVSTMTITFGFLYVKRDMKDYIDAALAMQGFRAPRTA